MAIAGEVIEHPVTGEKMIFRQTAQETNGTLLQIDLFVEPHGFVAGEHIHPLQEERFKIRSGNVQLRVKGHEQKFGEGEDAIIPPGTPHVWWNSGDTELHVVIEFLPALNIETFFENFFGLGKDGKTDRQGRPNPFQAAVMFQAFKDEMRLPLMPFGLLFPVLVPIGRLLGYQATYPKYSRTGG